MADSVEHPGEDALDTVIALRRPEDYSPEEGARFEVHFEKLRNRVEGDGAVPFEARIESVVAAAGEGVSWTAHALQPPIFKQAAELYGQGLSVRQVAAALRVSKSEAGRLRLRATDQGFLAGPSVKRGLNSIGSNSMEAHAVE